MSGGLGFSRCTHFMHGRSRMTVVGGRGVGIGGGLGGKAGRDGCSGGV